MYKDFKFFIYNFLVLQSTQSNDIPKQVNTSTMLHLTKCYNFFSLLKYFTRALVARFFMGLLLSVLVMGRPISLLNGEYSKSKFCTAARDPEVTQYSAIAWVEKKNTLMKNIIFTMTFKIIFQAGKTETGRVLFICHVFL